LLSMMKNPDPTARFLRYMPDGFAVREESEEAFFFDAKFGETIEKDAYLAYRTFAGSDRRGFVFIRHLRNTYCVPVIDLRCQDAGEVARRYPRPLAVDEDGWIAPRLLPRDEYLQWKSRSPQASGTSFRYFDRRAMRNYRFS